MPEKEVIEMKIELTNEQLAKAIRRACQEFSIEEDDSLSELLSELESE